MDKDLETKQDKKEVPIIKYQWIKEKFFEGVIGAVVTAVLFMAGFGVLEAYTSDYKRDKLRDELKQTIVDNYNDTVKREGQLLEKIAKLEKERQVLKPVKIPDVFMAPPLVVDPISPEQNINPVQQRLDYQNNNTKKYKD